MCLGKILKGRFDDAWFTTRVTWARSYYGILKMMMD